MNWVYPVLLLVTLYALMAYTIHSRKLFSDHVMFYGPIMAIKTDRVGFFDRFSAIRTFLRLYGTFGVLMVVLVSVFITVMLVISVRYTLILQPEPTGIYKPQNILLLPGINEYVPSTLAVWLAFIITIAVHEFGHGFLCRVENITVKGMGVILAVIPIGFFVEPDEEELEKTKGMPKMRMFGAGITNNLVVGFSCFVLLILLIGTAVPTTAPVIHGIYKDFPAEHAASENELPVPFLACHADKPVRQKCIPDRPVIGLGREREPYKWYEFRLIASRYTRQARAGMPKGASQARAVRQRSALR